MPRTAPAQYTVVMEVSLSPAQAEAIRRHARYTKTSQSAVLRALVEEAKSEWTDQEVTHDAQ